MFRRWNLFVALVVLGIGFVFGFVTHKYRTFPYPLIDRGVVAWRGTTDGVSPGKPPRPAGTWERARRDLPPEDRESLLSLPYLAGYEPAPGKANVTLHEEGLASPGLNLVVSGHAPGATLMDMEGRPLHEWRFDFRELWPERRQASRFWRRARVFPNGEVLGISDWVGMIKLDRDSNLLWAHAGGSHHDVFIAEDGRLFVLDHKRGVIPRVHPERPVRDDFITILDPEGRVLRSFSILEAFERSSYAPLLDRIEPRGDILHTNTISVLDGRFARRHPAFREGNVLISVRELDTIAIVDVDSESVAWALTGQWHRQHEPVFLDDGRLLLFDNRGAGGYARVIELDPLTQEIFWEYRGDPDQPLESPELGSCQRLPNGNTLITESTHGRAVEVTRDHRTVWEYVNPHRAGENNELIATLFEVSRLPYDFTETPFWDHPPDPARASGARASGSTMAVASD
jgi:hypothetical protein